MFIRYNTETIGGRIRVRLQMAKLGTKKGKKLEIF